MPLAIPIQNRVQLGPATDGMLLLPLPRELLNTPAFFQKAQIFVFPFEEKITNNSLEGLLSAASAHLQLSGYFVLVEAKQML